MPFPKQIPLFESHLSFSTSMIDTSQIFCYKVKLLKSFVKYRKFVDLKKQEGHDGPVSGLS